MRIRPLSFCSPFSRPLFSFLSGPLPTPSVPGSPGYSAECSKAFFVEWTPLEVWNLQVGKLCREQVAFFLRALGIGPLGWARWDWSWQRVRASVQFATTTRTLRVKGDAINNDARAICESNHSKQTDVWVPYKGQSLVLQVPFCFMTGSVGSIASSNAHRDRRSVGRAGPRIRSHSKGATRHQLVANCCQIFWFFTREAKHLDLHMKSPSF